MKLSLTPAFAAALLALATCPAWATPLDDCVAELKHAVEKEAAAHANGANPQAGFVNPGMSPAFIDATIDQLVSQMENPSYGGNMDAQLEQITSMYTSTEVQEATTNLLNEIKKERKDKADAEAADLQALIARVGPAITQAKKPEDLDALIMQMAKHDVGRYGGGSVMQGNAALVQQFNSAFQCLKTWQDYLEHLTSGQADQAANDLRTLSNNGYGDEFMPRSKLMELANSTRSASPAPGTNSATSTTTQAQAIVDEIKKPEDIEAGLQKLAPLRQNDMGGLQNICNELGQMQSAYVSIKAGLPYQYNPAYNGLLSADPVHISPELVQQMLMLTLQYQLSPFKGQPPAPGEKPVDFISRVIEDATSREDWDLLRRAAAARNSLTNNSGFGYSQPAGIENIVAAAHLDEAGQFALAVQAYETALKSDDPSVPAKIIGDKLAAIQRDHPNEYADGLKLTITPPAPRLYQVMGQPQPGTFPPAALTNPLATPIPASLLGAPATTNAAPAAPTK